jgi:hypothetical protein
VAQAVGLLVVVVTFMVALAALVWLAVRIRRRGIGGGLMGPIDEIWRPTAPQSRIEMQVQEERGAPAPAPRDPR